MLQTLFLFLIALITGVIFSDYIIVKKAKRFHHRGYIRGYHIHHSMYGVSIFFFLPLTFHHIAETIFLAGLGLGIIIEHTVHEGFKFIERVQGWKS